jgi:hypothetical protein
MKPHLLSPLALVVAMHAVLAQEPAFAQSELQRTHIEANVPPEDEFEPLLQRDLLSFFRQAHGPTVTAIEVQPLRLGPTQSGVSYPKFYLWVKAMAGSSVQQAGAVRVAAIQRTRFEVTDFLPVESIKKRPEEVGQVFPAALVRAIQERAASQ